MVALSSAVPLALHLNSYPRDPIILVEGKLDRIFLDRAFQLVPPGRKIRVTSLEEIKNEPGAGGVAALVDYVKSKIQAIKRT